MVIMFSNTHGDHFSFQALARVKKQDDKENQGWFGSVGSFISKSLYW